ncbi:MAG: hypothetical protein KME08_21140 [Aphanothece sp. CMT-3BRIN-NPC111]|jgi:hypothetical protein|nr:hypothetical protein [Aphanothece sp. CMT-3BRIN-NPC111]
MNATTTKKPVRLGELLVVKKLISTDELEQALALQSNDDRKLGEIMIEKDLVLQAQLERALKEQYWRNNGFWVID